MSEPVHLSSPLTFNNHGVAKTLVQGSPAEISNCVLDITLCFIGFREDLPEFGVPDLLFTQVPVDVEELQRAIARWEPRAQLTTGETEELVSSARRVSIEVG